MVETLPEQQKTRETSDGVAVTIASTVLFGALGATIGRYVGAVAESAERPLAKPFLTWLGGGFFAMLAAYTSLKMNAKHREAQSPTADGVVVKNIPSAVGATAKDVPHAEVSATTAEYGGHVVERHVQRAV